MELLQVIHGSPHRHREPESERRRSSGDQKRTWPLYVPCASKVIPLGKILVCTNQSSARASAVEFTRNSATMFLRSTRSRITRTASLSGLSGRFAMSRSIGSRLSSSDAIWTSPRWHQPRAATSCFDRRVVARDFARNRLPLRSPVRSNASF